MSDEFINFLIFTGFAIVIGAFILTWQEIKFIKKYIKEMMETKK